MTASAFAICHITKDRQFEFEKGQNGQFLIFDHVAHAQQFLEQNQLVGDWKIIPVSVETFCDSTSPRQILERVLR
ncbi:MAG TPA: hypothetical protein VIH17_03215 [Candidatus Acidoferrales bacterium]